MKKSIEFQWAQFMQLEDMLTIVKRIEDSVGNFFEERITNTISEEQNKNFT